MTELHALSGVHRAIDLALDDDPARVEMVVDLLPLYGQGGQGWSTALARTLVRHGSLEDPQAVYPTIEGALEGLVGTGPANPWEASRRLLALAALARVDDRYAPGGELGELVQRALMPLADPDSTGEELHAVIASGTLRHVDWAESVTRLLDAGLIHPEHHAMQSTGTCSGELVQVEVQGEVRAVTALSTHHCHPTFTIDDLEGFLDPAQWPECPGFWCEMIEEASATTATRRFLEVVSSDCAGAWSITTRLDFCRREFQRGEVALDYWLSDDQSMPADGLVLVDEGSILVEPRPEGGVCVTSTKRIRFVEPLDGAQLAMTACVFGWHTSGERFIFGCSHTPEDPDPEDEERS